MRISKQERLSKLLNKIRIRLDLKEGGLGDKKIDINEVRVKYPAYANALRRLSLINVKEDYIGPYSKTDERYKIGRPTKVVRQGVRLYASKGGFLIRKKSFDSD